MKIGKADKARIAVNIDAYECALLEFNRARNELHEQIEGIASDARCAWDERSEKWQEGDKGQEADADIQTLENLDWPDEIDEGMTDDLRNTVGI